MWVGRGRGERHRDASETETPIQGWINGAGQSEGDTGSLRALLQHPSILQRSWLQLRKARGGAGALGAPPPHRLHLPTHPTRAGLTALLHLHAAQHGSVWVETFSLMLHTPFLTFPLPPSCCSLQLEQPLAPAFTTAPLDTPLSPVVALDLWP